MLKYFSQDLNNLVAFPKNWYQEIVVIGFASLFMILHAHHKI